MKTKENNLEKLPSPRTEEKTSSPGDGQGKIENRQATRWQAGETLQVTTVRGGGRVAGTTIPSICTLS